MYSLRKASCGATAETQRLMTKYPEPSIEYPATSIQYPASRHFFIEKTGRIWYNNNEFGVGITPARSGKHAETRTS